MSIREFLYQVICDSDLQNRQIAMYDEKNPRRLAKAIKYDSDWGVIRAAAKVYCTVVDKPSQAKFATELKVDTRVFGPGYRRFDLFVVHGILSADRPETSLLRKYLDELSVAGLVDIAMQTEAREQPELLSTVVNRLCQLDQDRAKQLLDTRSPRLGAAIRKCLGMPRRPFSANYPGETSLKRNKPEQALIPELESSDKDVRISAMAKLIQAGSRVVPALIDVLNDFKGRYSYELRIYVAYTLVEIGDARAVEAMEEAFRNTTKELAHLLDPEEKLGSE